MSKKVFEVYFTGRVLVEVDTADYPHYANGSRAGWKRLAEDLVGEHAQLDGSLFKTGSFKALRPQALEMSNV